MLIKTQSNIAVCGVYAIQTKDEVVIYAGGSEQCNDACSRHKSNLKYGRYANTNKHIMQELHDKEDLYFKIIEVCTEDMLDDLESYYIDLYSQTICNRDKKAKRRKTITTSEETERRRLSNIGQRNPNNKYDIDTIIEVKQMLSNGVPTTEIEKKTGISKAYISQIKSGYKWSCVDILI